MMIALNAVSFRYPRGNWILKDINLHIESKKCTFMVGPNGGGKTTLGKLMTGILKPTLGDVFVDKLNTKQAKLYQVGTKVGYLFQEPERQIFAATVRDELAFVMELKGIEKEVIEQRVEVALVRFQLQEVADSFPFQLSRGEKQRLALATVLMNNPSFLILDEPTTGLDVERKERLSEIIRELKKRGTGMVIISHDERFVEKHADRIIIVAGGGVRDGG